VNVETLNFVSFSILMATIAMSSGNTASYASTGRPSHIIVNIPGSTSSAPNTSAKRESITTD